MSPLIGKRFGKLVVQRMTGFRKFLCLCDCGREIILCRDTLKQGKIDCGCVIFSTKDITGRKFGRWTVLGPEKELQVGKWKCRCDCGKEKVVLFDTLTSGQSSSCGCLHHELVAERCRESVKDLSGQRFGRLVVLSREGSRLNRIRWLCQCDCGKIKSIQSGALKSGNTKSCGCYKSELAVKRFTNPNLTAEDRLRRRIDPRNLEWRLAVYAKDNFVCQICGDYIKGRLVAHHKESWRSSPEKRYDVSNGVVCCKKHHREFHSFFGYGDNIEVQWNQFVQMKNGVIKIERPPIKRRISVDLVGRKFGRLTVVKPDVVRGKFKWICRCDCGEIRSVYENSLKRGNTRSCGCAKNERVAEMGRRKLKDLTGQRFGRLVVKGRLSIGRWKCKCDCGQERIVDIQCLRDGKATDCQSHKNGNKCVLRRMVA